MISTLEILKLLQIIFLFQILLFLALACAVLISGKSTGKMYGKRGKFYASDP